MPVPYVDEQAAELLFRHKVIRLLRRRWRDLIRCIYEVDPVVCPRCETEMRRCLHAHPLMLSPRATSSWASPFPLEVHF